MDGFLSLVVFKECCCPLTCVVSSKGSDVILSFVPLYLMCFFLCYFNIFSISLVLGNSIMMDPGVVS